MQTEASRALRRHIDAKKAEFPHLAEHLDRQFLIALHTREVVTIDAIHAEARALAGKAPREIISDPNQPEGVKLDQAERHFLRELTYDYVCEHFTPEEVDDVIELALKRDAFRAVDDYAQLKDVPTRLLAQKLAAYCRLPFKETKLPQSEVIGTRVALIRHFISDQLEFIGIAKNHVTIRDVNAVAGRMIDLEEGQGRIGGKAGGMVLASCILAGATDLHPDWPVRTPESWFLRSDVLSVFMEINRLTEYQNQKYKPIDEIRHEYPLVKGVFRNSDFPVEVVQQLRAFLQEIGTHPLIVRSSSLLEDRVGAAFSGKYASVFVANQGDLETRLQALLVAISEVFASTLAPDPIAYRRERNLIDYHEDMAVLIQKVIGRKVGPYFLPAFAGVAFSRNEYRWSPRIKRDDGLMRLVMGLGTRAVDRVASDYPRMVALGCPTLRPETRPAEVMKYAQRTLDAINLETNRLESVRLDELLALGGQYPVLDKIVSIFRDGELYAPTGTRVNAPPSNLCITFDKLLANTSFAEAVRKMLQHLEKAYGGPVDVEFAFDGEHFYLLQCRCLAADDETTTVRIPSDVPERDRVFSANRYVRTGFVGDIEYVVYVGSEMYDSVESQEQRIEIGRVVGRLNRALASKRFILVGPGRWGSNDIQLGVRVGYADINETQMLIEVARAKAGYVPEVSFGTHFFQDLVEARIQYLPLYPDEPGNVFNEAFFAESPSKLASLLPGDADYSRYVRCLHVPSVTAGRLLHISMDGDHDRALAYLR
jgi:hypothetical protein